MIHYEHPGIEIKYVAQSNSHPSVNAKTTRETNNERSYVTLKINISKTIETLGKLFNFNRYNIVGAMCINDKRRKQNNQVKLTFSLATPPTELTDNTEVGFTYTVEPSLMCLIRCNNCHVGLDKTQQENVG